MPNISQNLGKQVGSGAKQVAGGLARMIAQNAKKAGETAKSQIGVPASEKGVSTEDMDMLLSDPVDIATQAPQINADAIHARERELLSSLESQLAMVRQQQSEKLRVYNQAVNEQLQMANHAKASQESVEPQGKVRKAMGKVKKAVSSILGKKQGETKQGSGKG